MDKSLPHIGVLMTKSDIGEYPKHHLPAGYRLCLYQPGLEEWWNDIQVAAGHFETVSEAQEHFKSEFATSLPQLSQRCVFVTNHSGQAVATAMLWLGDHFGKMLPRIHWVAVRPDYQGIGLAKALTTELCDMANRFGCREWMYLTSQTWSYRAINIYLHFGFTPYLGEKPVNWKCNATSFEQQNTYAWKLITEKIRNRTGGEGR